MNPLVKVSAAAGGTDPSSSSAAADELAGQDLVIATGLPLGQLQVLNEAARRAGANFMAGGAGGPGGWFFVDLRQHTYVPKVRQGGTKAKQCCWHELYSRHVCGWVQAIVLQSACTHLIQLQHNNKRFGDHKGQLHLAAEASCSIWHWA
jgi:hypothetical protein